MIDFRTEIKQVATIEELLQLVYPVMDKMVNEEGRYTEAGVPIVVCPEAEDEEDAYFQEDRQFSFYVPCLSTRPVVVWREQQTMIVRALGISSPTDFALALQILKALRRFGAVSVVNDYEPDTPVGFDFLEKKFSPDFYMSWTRACLRKMMATCADDESACFVLSGPFYDFHFGTVMNSIFGRWSDEITRLEKLHEMMLDMNYWFMSEDAVDIKFAPTSDTEDGVTVAYIELYRPLVVPKADHYCFYKGENIMCLMERQEFFDRFEFGDQFELMDEFQTRLHISEADVEWLMNGDVVHMGSRAV